MASSDAKAPQKCTAPQSHLPTADRHRTNSRGGIRDSEKDSEEHAQAKEGVKEKKIKQGGKSQVGERDRQIGKHGNQMNTRKDKRNDQKNERITERIKQDKEKKEE